MVVSSPTSMILSVDFQPFDAPGIFTTWLTADDSNISSSFSLADAANFTVVAVAQPPTIISVSPSTASSTSGSTIELRVAGFPLPLEVTDLTVTFGKQVSSISAGPTSDGKGGAFLSVLLLGGVKSGPSEVTITYSPPQGASMGWQDKPLNASALFLFQADGITVSCIDGCNIALTPAAETDQTLTVEIAAIRQGLLPSSNVFSSLAITCYAHVNGHPATDKNSDCEVTAFSAVALCSDAILSSAAGGCLSLTVQITVAANAAEAAISPSVTGYLVVSTTNAVTEFLATAPFDLLRPPRLTAAAFSSSYISITITFDTATASPSLPCTSLLLIPGNPTGLGVAPVCSWLTPSTLQVVLGSGATLLPGDVLQALPAAFANPIGDRRSGAALQAVIIAEPAQPQLPRVSVSGPQSVGGCDIAQLVALATAVPGGAVYEWNCPSDTLLDTFLRNSTSGPVVNIPGTMLAPGRTYTVTVSARNRFGDVSEKVLHKLAHTTTPGPQPSILLPPPPLLRSQNIILTASVALSSCAIEPSSVDFRWSVALSANQAIGTPLGSPLLLGVGFELTVPMGLLAVGSMYVATVTCIFSGGIMPAQTAQTFQLDASHPVARLAGGDHSVSSQAILVLDATQSYNPDTCTYENDPTGSGQPICSNIGENLTFSWACSIGGALCRSTADGAIMQLGSACPVASLDLGSLIQTVLPPFDVDVTVTVTSAAGLDSQARDVLLPSFVIRADSRYASTSSFR